MYLLFGPRINRAITVTSTYHHLRFNMSFSAGVYASVDNDSFYVSESDGVLHVCVEIIGTLESRITIDVQTANGSALGMLVAK